MSRAAPVQRVGRKPHNDLVSSGCEPCSAARRALCEGAERSETAAVAVLIVTWNHSRVIERCLRALDQATVPLGGFRVLILDNASADGTADRIRAYLSKRSSARLRHVPMQLFCASQNTGFAGGMNWLAREALRCGSDFLYLLNPDTVVEPQFLVSALSAMGDPRVGIVQSLLLVHAASEHVNSWGNELHWFGFGCVGGHGCRIGSAAARANVRRREIGYASGAAMLVRAEVFRGIGSFDERLFAYHEDLEFSWRARLAGWRILLEPGSVVYHDYDFARYRSKFCLAERNRVVVLLSCFQTSTLALLSPALLCAEGAVWLAAVTSGWWGEKWRSYRLLWRTGTLRWIRERRRLINRLRRYPDRALVQYFSTKLPGQDAAPILARVLLLMPLQLYCRAVATVLWLTQKLRSILSRGKAEPVRGLDPTPASANVPGPELPRRAA